MSARMEPASIMEYYPDVEEQEKVLETEPVYEGNEPEPASVEIIRKEQGMDETGKEQNDGQQGAGSLRQTGTKTAGQKERTERMEGREKAVDDKEGHGKAAPVRKKLYSLSRPPEDF